MHHRTGSSLRSVEEAVGADALDLVRSPGFSRAVREAEAIGAGRCERAGARAGYRTGSVRRTLTTARQKALGSLSRDRVRRLLFESRAAGRGPRPRRRRAQDVSVVRSMSGALFMVQAIGRTAPYPLHNNLSRRCQ